MKQKYVPPTVSYRLWEKLTTAQTYDSKGYYIFDKKIQSKPMMIGLIFNLAAFVGLMLFMVNINKPSAVSLIFLSVGMLLMLLTGALFTNRSINFKEKIDNRDMLSVVFAAITLFMLIGYSLIVVFNMCLTHIFNLKS